VTNIPDSNIATIRRALGDSYLDLQIERLTMEENFSGGQAKVEVVTRGAGGEPITVRGEGVGFIDALFSGLFQRFAAEYQSLATIRLTGFAVNAKLDADKGRFGSDAVGEVMLEVQNSAGRPFRFSDASRSIVASAARAVLAAVEYFANSERAFISLHRALSDAQARKRPDLVAQYTRELAAIVESTSYAEVIESIKKTL
jgi:hypothetical protein